MKKNIISKKKFLELNISSAKKMNQDAKLKSDALKLFSKADKYRWIHQTKWFGEPVLNIAEDLFTIQDIIWRTKPDYIIETGVAWGGSSLFYSLLLNFIGGKKYIGIDIFIPNDLKKRIYKHKKLNKNLLLINDSSLSQNTISKIKKIIKGSKKVMVILDSYHTHSHVLKELNIYSKFVFKGQYLICGDTVVNDIPNQTHRPREWNNMNNPYTALVEFLKINKKQFQIDKEICNKLLMSNQAKGYLKSFR